MDASSARGHLVETKCFTMLPIANFSPSTALMGVSRMQPGMSQTTKSEPSFSCGVSAKAYVRRAVRSVLITETLRRAPSVKISMNSMVGGGAS